MTAFSPLVTQGHSIQEQEVACVRALPTTHTFGPSLDSHASPKTDLMRNSGALVGSEDVLWYHSVSNESFVHSFGFLNHRMRQVAFLWALGATNGSVRLEIIYGRKSFTTHSSRSLQALD